VPFLAPLLCDHAAPGVFFLQFSAHSTGIGLAPGHTLFLWRNEPTVVIGRCQNPWKECNVQAMQAKGVHLARRTSGGGAVYQDLGNTNFTFLSSTENFDKLRNRCPNTCSLHGRNKECITAHPFTFKIANYTVHHYIQLKSLRIIDALIDGMRETAVGSLSLH
jgi:hypothetical protein